MIVQTSGQSRRRRAPAEAPGGIVRSFTAAVVLALAAFVALATGGTARAQSREDGAPAESLGLADAVRASAWGPSAIYANPAGLMRVHLLMVEATYSYLDGKDGHNFGGAVVDSKTNTDVALGVAYNYFSTAPDGRDRDGNQVRVALATGYLSDDMALYAGVGVRWLDLALGKDDDDEGVTETDDIDAWTADVGLMLSFDDRIRFGLVGQNLVDTGTVEAPRLLGFGLAFVFGLLEVSGNLDLDLSDDADKTIGSWGFGADVLVADTVHLRAGFVRDEPLSAERLSFGLGWSNESVAIDLGTAFGLTDPAATTFGVALRFVP